MGRTSIEQQSQLSIEQEVLALHARICQLESELTRTHRLATLGMLAGSIAHEFNNVMTPIMSYAQMAMAAPQDADLTSKALRKAAEGTERAAKIASSMLGFIRDNQEEPIAELREVIDDTLSCLAREPCKDGITMTIEVPSPCWVAMRPVALQQILMNLILNAIEAVKPGGGEIKIGLVGEGCSTWNITDDASTPQIEPQIELVVADSGSGIDPGMLDRIFEPLVSTTESRGGRKGTGLGLSICRTLVEEVGGSIHATSKAGHGAKFMIKMPTADAPATSRTQRAA